MNENDGHPLTHPIYTIPKTPEMCTMCGRGARFMRRIYEVKDFECSHSQCPHRDHVTARPKDKP